MLVDLVANGDARHAWLVADLMRFSGGPDEVVALVGAFRTLTGVDPSPDPTFAESPSESVTDHPHHLGPASAAGRSRDEGLALTLVEPGWAFFADADATC